MRLIAAVFLLLLALPAWGKAFPDKGISAEELAAAMRAKGYRAEIARDDEGDPMVRSGVAGVNFQVFFYDCKDDRCGSLQFSAGFDLDKGAPWSLTNDWNAKWRFVYAYLDKESDPYLAMDVEMRGGASEAQLGHWLDRWEELVGKFAAEVWNKPPAVEREAEDSSA